MLLYQISSISICPRKVTRFCDTSRHIPDFQCLADRTGGNLLNVGFSHAESRGREVGTPVSYSGTPGHMMSSLMYFVLLLGPPRQVPI
jgi:hypothetical protein